MPPLNVSEIASALAAFQPSINGRFWVSTEVQELLEQQTARSGLLLRGMLAPVRLMPVIPDIGRAYYRAETAIGVFELLSGSDAGSNSLQWWRRGESNPRPKAFGQDVYMLVARFYLAQRTAHAQAAEGPVT